MEEAITKLFPRTDSVFIADVRKLALTDRLARDGEGITKRFELEGTFQGRLVQPRAMGMDIFNWIRLLRALSNLALKVSRDGASPVLWSKASGQPGPGPHHPHCKKFLPYILSECPLFQFKTIPPCPIATCLPKKPIHLSYKPLLSTERPQ